MIILLLKENEDNNKASLEERRSLADHLQELHNWLQLDQQNRHASFRALQERIQNLHNDLARANLNVPPPPPLRAYQSCFLKLVQ